VLRDRFASTAASKRQEPARNRERKKKKKGRKEARLPAPPDKPPRRSPSWGRIVISAGILAAVVTFGAITLSFSFTQLQYGIGITRHKFSFAAAEFLRKNPIPGNMFNFFDIGGFLDWQLYPQALTFIDGRTYNREVFQEHQTVTGALPGWKDVLRKYGIDYVVLKAVDSSGLILPVIPALARDPDWALVFSDGLFVIFVRNTPQNREYLSQHAIPKSALPRHVIEESYHYMYLGVSPVAAYANIVNMYLTMGKRQEAIAVLQNALREHDDRYLRNMLMQVEQGGGRSPSAGEQRR